MGLVDRDGTVRAGEGFGHASEDTASARTCPSSVEVWLHQEKAAADATADTDDEGHFKVVFQTDTVVEDWAVRPSPDERAPTKECVSGE